MERFPTKTEEEPKKEKPKLLYHGSPHGGLEELHPKSLRSRDREEGERVFATPDLSLATVFMTNAYRSCGYFGDVLYVCITEPREKFIKHDEGGHIYVLPSDNFSFNPSKGLREREWTSDKKVKPVDKIEFPSVLDAMIENGVQVYFVDEETNKRISEANDHGLSVFESLQSENQKRGLNVKVFPK